MKETLILIGIPDEPGERITNVIIQTVKRVSKQEQRKIDLHTIPPLLDQKNFVEQTLALGKINRLILLTPPFVKPVNGVNDSNVLAKDFAYHLKKLRYPNLEIIYIVVAASDQEPDPLIDISLRDYWHPSLRETYKQQEKHQEVFERIFEVIPVS